MATNVIIHKELSITGVYDVIVVGGGPSGCTAAASAAREGAKTLLIEATGALGGMGTNGLVPAWCPFSDRIHMIYRGMAEQIFNASKKLCPHVGISDLDWVPINPEGLKRVYDEFVTRYGAHVLFNTTLSDVQTDEKGRVEAIIVSGKRGLEAYQASVFVDCTGDADLTAWAGGEYVQGDPATGELMPATLCFILTNVDEYAYRYDSRNGLVNGSLHGDNPNSVVYEMARDEKYPLIADSHLCSNIIGPRTVGFNAGHLWHVDNTDPDGLSAALGAGRCLAEQYRQALAEYFPSAFGASYLVQTAPLMGIREGRRIVGDYTMTMEDYRLRRTFADEISRNCYYIDIHLSPEDAAADLKHEIDTYARGMHYQPGESHGIPYRSLLPRKLLNVLVAGRSISCERPLQASVRVMPNCLCTGEAAGMAAAQASSNDGDVHSVNIEHLRQRLREEGAFFL